MDRTRSLGLQLTDIAGLFTVGAVGLSMSWIPPAVPWIGWGSLAAFTALMVLFDRVETRAPKLGFAILAAMPMLALVLLLQTPRLGTAQVLLVIWTVMVVMALPLRHALPVIAVADIAAYGIVRAQGHEAPAVVTLLYVGFQAFGMLTAWYARRAERARDALALVNADLLATRALLADSARDRERLRLARDLHDVAGHKLTALKLNLRALAADPALAARDELQVSAQLAAELLHDIRGIVHALRDADGLDLATAMQALAAPLPRPRLRLAIDPAVRVRDPACAELLLRMVQEAVTNSARHSQARHLDVELSPAGGQGLRLVLADDGRLPAPVHEGNGLTGMRERVEEAGGRLRIDGQPGHPLRIEAWLPA